MATITNLKGVSLTAATNDELRNYLFERRLHVPTNDDGQLLRGHAISMLHDWRQQYEAVDTGRKCRVIFHASSNPSSGPYVFASINTKNFQAPYGKEVVVPEYMLRECIDRAVSTEYHSVKDELGRQYVKEVLVPVYPYTMLGYVEEEKQEEPQAPVDPVTLVEVPEISEEIMKKRRGRPRKVEVKTV